MVKELQVWNIARVCQGSSRQFWSGGQLSTIFEQLFEFSLRSVSSIIVLVIHQGTDISAAAYRGGIAEGDSGTVCTHGRLAPEAQASMAATKRYGIGAQHLPCPSVHGVFQQRRRDHEDDEQEKERVDQVREVDLIVNRDLQRSAFLRHGWGAPLFLLPGGAVGVELFDLELGVDLVDEGIEVDRDVLDLGRDDVQADHGRQRHEQRDHGGEQSAGNAGRERLDVGLARLREFRERDRDAPDRAEQPQERAAADRGRQDHGPALQDHKLVKWYEDIQIMIKEKLIGIVENKLLKIKS